MANIDKLKNRILKEDNDKAKEIENNAKIKAGQTLLLARKKASDLLEETKIKAEKDGIEKKDRMISRSQLEARNVILDTKQNTINNVFNLAIDKINKMDKQEYSMFLEKLLLKSTETGNEDVIFSNKDKDRIDIKIVDNVNKKLQEQGKACRLKLSNEWGNIPSGFILKSSGLEINCTIEAQIRFLRDELEGEIAALLF